MNPLSQFKNITILPPLLIALAFVVTMLPLSARAVDRGNQNTSDGAFALWALTTGFANTAIGFDALKSTTTGFDNTGVGAEVLNQNITGFYNTALGFEALFFNTANFNTALGTFSLLFNTTGASNTGVGLSALYSNTSGGYNTGTGYDALYFNTTGYYNTATGAQALFYNLGSYNTATGYQALIGTYGNSTGGYNTASGFASLPANTTGYFNTADGVFALFTNHNGYQNAGSGVSALYNNTTGHDNTAIGFQALGNNQHGNYNIGVGSNGGVFVTGTNNIAIGNPGAAGESGKIRIGTKGTHNAAFLAGVNGSAITGTSVVVNSNGRLGTAASSQRFKDDIKPMDKASEAIHALKPVTFHYKKEVDPEGIAQFGLVAEDVETVNPDLVARDAEGKPYTVRYEAVNAMLLNEFLKEHRKNEEQEATIARQQKQIEALTAGLQKVSAQIEASKPAAQMAANNQ